MPIRQGSVARAAVADGTSTLFTQPTIPKTPRSEWVKTSYGKTKLSHGRKIEEDYFRLLDDKNIILVGPAAYLQGSGMGAEIDSYDLIVRLNLACPVPDHQYADIGSRTDVLYHTLFRDRHMKERPDLFQPHTQQDVMDWIEKDGLQWVVIKPRHETRHAQKFAHAINGIMPWCTISAYHHRQIKAFYKTSPNMGSIAIWHILKSKCKSLYVTGCDFHTTGYFVGYGGFTEEMAAKGARDGAAMKSTWGQTIEPRELTNFHFVPHQLESLSRLVQRDHRLMFDDVLMDLVRGYIRR